MKFTCIPGRFALATLALMLLAPAASAETIRCPVSQIQSEVTTNLPNGWWNTPIANSLTDTRIITFSGGRKALQCVYGPAGSIQRYAPEGDCRAVRGGFECAARATPGPTYSTGEVQLRQTYQVNFDNGSIGSNGADLWFQAETASLLYLTPINGARIGVGNRSNRGRDGCASARMTTSRVSLSDVPVGSYVCMKTNEGRISQFRLNNVSGGSPKTLTIGYTTWR
ncbi:MAG: hypothetical protein HUJ27_15765 [Rhodobacteraceae bacterium]|nr:hypothetical protein [Paracoccaceae bacterium]